MLSRGAGRIVLMGSGAAYLKSPTIGSTYGASKAAVWRFGELLAGQLAGRIPVFVISPGLVRTDLTIGLFPEEAPWSSPDLAPALVRKLASGRYDALAGRYIQAHLDDVDDLLARVGEIQDHDLNTIRLRR